VAQRGVGGSLRITKHHGAGNDFLVLVDLEGLRPVGPFEVRALCDRRTGVGADGLLRLVAPELGTDIGMELWNADGSIAEMSGNGIRCLVQAAVHAGVVTAGTVSVSTAAGPKSVEFETSEEPGLGFASVDMGTAVLGTEIDRAGLSARISLETDDDPRTTPATAARELSTVKRSRLVRIGNPHIVLMSDRAERAVVTSLGPRLECSEPGGANVELFSVGPGRDELSLVVWERGAGETLACGTGSCAVAVAAHSWGEVGERVAVHNPGGTLGVTITGASVWLSGPTRHVADVTVEEDVLAQLAQMAQLAQEQAVAATATDLSRQLPHEPAPDPTGSAA